MRLLACILFASCLWGDPAVAAGDAIALLPSWQPEDREGRFRLIPHAMAVDPLGSLWILDRSRGRLMRLDADGAGDSFSIQSEEGKSVAAVSDLAASGTYLYVLEPPTPSVILIDLDGNFREQVNLAGEIEDAGYRGFLASRLLVGRSGDLWLIEVGTGGLLHLDRRGRFVDAPLEALPGSTRPKRIDDAVLGPDDELFLLDLEGGRILVLGYDGSFLSEQPLDTDLRGPASLTVDKWGTRYLLDASKRLRIVSRGKSAEVAPSVTDKLPDGVGQSAVSPAGVVYFAHPESGTITRLRVARAEPEDADR